MPAPGRQLRQLLVESAERGDVYVPECPSRAVLDHITSRWGVLVLVGLLGGPLRFSELRRLVGGVSDKMLAQTLKLLQHDGFVARGAYLEMPMRVEYSLTDLGTEAAERLGGLVEWLQSNIGRVLTNA